MHKVRGKEAKDRQEKKGRHERGRDGGKGEKEKKKGRRPNVEHGDSGSKMSKSWGPNAQLGNCSEQHCTAHEKEIIMM